MENKAPAASVFDEETVLKLIRIMGKNDKYDIKFFIENKK